MNSYSKADKQIIIRKIKLFTFLMTKHRCLHLISYEMEGLTAIVEGNEAIFFFSSQKSAEADCPLRNLIENLKTETSQQGKEND